MSDFIDRQAAINRINKQREHLKPDMNERDSIGDAAYRVCAEFIERLPSAQPEQQWIPVKFRPMDSEEREYWEEQFGEELADEDAVMFDCPMPDDGKEILVSYRKWINMDKCEIDGGCYGLEGNGDWEGVVAWMPLPKPYRSET